MPLIDLLTDLKTLKFGKDRPGGGDSGLPYIKTPLPENATAIEKAAIDAGKFSIDFPIRGGAKAVTDKVTDTIRITKFFGDGLACNFFNHLNGYCTWSHNSGSTRCAINNR